MQSAIGLARYAQRIQYGACAFFGVFRSDAPYEGQCRNIWSQIQRDAIEYALAEAQEEIEAQLGYFLSGRYVVGSLAAQPDGDDRYVDDQAYSNPLSARYPKVIEAGVRAESVISSGAAVSHVTDPAVIGPLATSVTNSAEVKVFHPGTDVEIPTTSVTLAGGNVTITISRCYMILLARQDNPPEGLDYTDLTNFESTVDVTRVYTDASVNADLVAAHNCGDFCLAGGCSEFTQTACIYKVDGRLGILRVSPASYADGTWSGASGGCCRATSRARLNYRAGLASLNKQAEDTIIRLAHSKMPSEPCGCEVTQRLWRRDRHEPDVMTRERINCPFGMSDGAWIAWRFTQTMRQVRGSIL